MDKTIKDRWVKALRSGDYEQGYNTLTFTNGDGVRKYCCLGVLCDLAIQDGVEGVRYNGDAVEYRYTRSYGEGWATDVGMLPPQVVEWAGLDGENPEIVYGTASGEKYAQRLTIMNDALKQDFHQIADQIERGL